MMKWTEESKDKRNISCISMFYRKCNTRYRLSTLVHPLHFVDRHFLFTRPSLDAYTHKSSFSYELQFKLTRSRPSSSHNMETTQLTDHYRFGTLWRSRSHSIPSLITIDEYAHCFSLQRTIVAFVERWILFCTKRP